MYALVSPLDFVVFKGCHPSWNLRRVLMQVGLSVSPGSHRFIPSNSTLNLQNIMSTVRRVLTSCCIDVDRAGIISPVPHHYATYRARLTRLPWDTCATAGIQCQRSRGLGSSSPYRSAKERWRPWASSTRCAPGANRWVDEPLYNSYSKHYKCPSYSAYHRTFTKMIIPSSPNP